MSDVSLLNCVVSGFKSAITDAGLSITDTDCQYEWIPPVLPQWNDLPEYFSWSILGVGINTPPQPGNSPYVDYPAGLFGEPRLGIGAMLFDEPPPGMYIDLKDNSSGGAVVSRLWKILNRSTMLYEEIGTTEEILNRFFNMEDTDYALYDPEEYSYSWELRLTVNNADGSDTKDRTFTIINVPT